MNFRKRFNLHFFIAAFVSIGMVCLVIYNPSQNASSQEKEFKLEDVRLFSKMEKFGVVDLEKSGDRLIQIKFKNQYDKAITAYQVSFGKVRTTEELIYDQKSFILPGATYTTIYPIQNLMAENVISILAVIFEDGTADGDVDFIREVREIRMGKSIVLNRFLAKLQSVLDPSSTPVTGALDDLESQVANFSGDSDTNLSANIRYGIKVGRTDLLQQVRQLKNGNNSKLDLEILKQKCEQMSLRLGRKPATVNK
jgi:hypothetical protein